MLKHTGRDNTDYRMPAAIDEGLLAATAYLNEYHEAERVAEFYEELVH